MEILIFNTSFNQSQPADQLKIKAVISLVERSIECQNFHLEGLKKLKWSQKLAHCLSLYTVSNVTSHFILTDTDLPGMFLLSFYDEVINVFMFSVHLKMSFKCSSELWGLAPCAVKVIIEKSRGEVSLMEQDTIENVS